MLLRVLVCVNGCQFFYISVYVGVYLSLFMCVSASDRQVCVSVRVLACFLCVLEFVSVC